MTQRSPDADLSALLDAVLSGEVSPEQLALFAANPEALDPDERGSIEREVAASPALADQLLILQTFDAKAALAEAPSAKTDFVLPPERAGRLRPPAHRPRWLLRWAPAVAAAAAGFLLAIVFVQGLGPAREQGDRIAALETQLQGARERATQLETELASARERASQRDEQVASLERRASELEQQVAAAQASEQASRSELVALREEAARRTERIATHERSGVTKKPAQAIPDPARSESDPFQLREPLQIAMASVYEVPDPSAAVIRPTLRSGRPPGVPVPEALAPERVGWTLESHPTLYWYASQGSKLRSEFTLTRERDGEPIVQRALPTPERAGVQRIELSDLGIALDEGESYRWSVSLVDPANPGRPVFAIGGVRRVAPPASLRAITDETPAPERIDALERAGLWYDAFDLISRWVERNPDAANLVARRDAMLARVGIHLRSDE